ncbi:MAG: tyrosine-type recombinase/integrase [Candidatus Obscuribacterales bacterium]|nr:tyrosine-type recombinase/integrase [Candidatus Obscuribacterales bacterium]
MNSTLLKTAYQHLQKYETWLKKQPVSAHTRRAYRSRLNHFLVFIATSNTDFGELFTNPNDRDFAAREYKTHMKRSLKFKPSTVNTTLAALDHFYTFLGLGHVTIKRDELPQIAPQGLTEKEQKQFLRVIQSCKVKEKAIGLLLFYTGIRIGECAALDLEDVSISPRKGQITIRSGKNDNFRTVPLNVVAREGIEDWIELRRIKYKSSKDKALFLNPQGNRISTAGIDLIVRKIGRLAKIELSAHTLRHTCITNLVRQGNDLVLVADIGGHKSLETTRRYSLPTEADREVAMDRLVGEA